MLVCDGIRRTEVGAVLAADLSLSTVSVLVFFHGAALYCLTTTKGARAGGCSYTPSCHDQDGSVGLSPLLSTYILLRGAGSEPRGH